MSKICKAFKKIDDRFEVLDYGGHLLLKDKERDVVQCLNCQEMVVKGIKGHNIWADINAHLGLVHLPNIKPDKVQHIALS